MSHPINKIRAIDKLKVALFGRTRIDKTEHYLFRCPNHGLLIDVEHGYHLQGSTGLFHRCPFCQYRYLM